MSHYLNKLKNIISSLLLWKELQDLLINLIVSLKFISYIPNFLQLCSKSHLSLYQLIELLTESVCFYNFFLVWSFVLTKPLNLPLFLYKETYSVKATFGFFFICVCGFDYKAISLRVKSTFNDERITERHI